MSRADRLQELGRVLHEASAALVVAGDRALAPRGMTSAQWKVLATLALLGDARIADLVAYLGHDQASVSRLVARMEARGLLRRVPDPRDARAQLVSMTLSGRETVAWCRRVLGTLIDHATADLSDAQLQHVAEALAALTVGLARGQPTRDVSHR